MTATCWKGSGFNQRQAELEQYLPNTGFAAPRPTRQLRGLHPDGPMCAVSRKMNSAGEGCGERAEVRGDQPALRGWISLLPCWAGSVGSLWASQGRVVWRHSDGRGLRRDFLRSLGVT